MPPVNQLIDRQRRSYLNYALAGTTLLATDTSAAATACGLCVRSPWAYYHLSTALAAGGKASADYGNEWLPSLRSLTDDEGQWVPSGWIGDGVARGLEIDWLSDPLGLDAVAAPGTGALLIGVAILHPRNVRTSETIVNIGRRGGGAGFIDSGLELKINGQGRANVTVWDDNSAKVAATVNATGIYAAGPDAGGLALFVYIDNRPGSSRSVALYQYQIGTTNRWVKSKSIAALGPISGGTDSADKALTVGYRKTGGSRTASHYRGSIRKLNIINFANRPPADIDYIMDQFSIRGMTPAGFLEGL